MPVGDLPDSVLSQVTYLTQFSLKRVGLCIFIVGISKQFQAHDHSGVPTSFATLASLAAGAGAFSWVPFVMTDEFSSKTNRQVLSCPAPCELQFSRGASAFQYLPPRQITVAWTNEMLWFTDAFSPERCHSKTFPVSHAPSPRGQPPLSHVGRIHPRAYTTMASRPGKQMTEL